MAHLAPEDPPEQVDPDPAIHWTALEIIDAGEDTVEFRARHSAGTLHERSRFERRAGRWFYLDGLID